MPLRIYLVEDNPIILKWLGQTLEELTNCTITISLEDESLFEQLDTLCKVLDASYKMANNAQIIFESAGCKAT